MEKLDILKDMLIEVLNEQTKDLNELNKKYGDSDDIPDEKIVEFTALQASYSTLSLVIEKIDQLKNITN